MKDVNFPIHKWHEHLQKKSVLEPVIYLSNFSSITFNTFLYVLLGNNWKLKF